ncbi:MAG: Arm DNA-binding domain-containing protein [Bacteroidales bacterium]|nr:Arm DNA-binding domain-containing protein [Bacteroidales bacterium]
MTFHFELCNHPNKKGDYSVFLLIFHKGQKKRIKTSILIPDRFWDPVWRRVRNSKDSLTRPEQLKGNSSHRTDSPC